MAEYDVIVIGAGFAGLSAAVRMVRQGARVLVLEARSRLGGRATAITDKETGELVDNGQHVLLGCYTATLEFLEEIGARDFLRSQSTLSVTMIDRSGRRSRLICPSLPSPLHLVAGVMDWEALTWADRFAVLRMATPIRIAKRQFLSRNGHAGRIAASPGETVENWLIRNGQTPRLIEMLWEPLAIAALNQSPSTAAAPTFARVLAEMFGRDPRAAAILLPSKPLTEAYAEPARRYIERAGGSVRTGAPAMVQLKDDHVDEVVCGDLKWQAARVIVAVPWFAFADLFVGDVEGLEPLLERSRGMTASPIVTVNLWFDGTDVPLMDDPVVGLPGREMQWVFDKRVIFGDSRSHLSLVSSGASSLVGRTNAELIDIAHRELMEVLPAARSTTAIRGSVVREPRATFSLAPGEPARPSTTTAVHGLYLAGDWIDTGLPATIESAVRSGHLAAQAAWDTTVR